MILKHVDLCQQCFISKVCFEAWLEIAKSNILRKTMCVVVQLKELIVSAVNLFQNCMKLKFFYFLFLLQKQPHTLTNKQYLKPINMLELSIPITAWQSSQQVTCTLRCLSVIYIKHQGRGTATLLFHTVRWSSPPAWCWGFRWQSTWLNSAGCQWGGWPAMGLKDNAVPRVALMTLKCWAITGTWTGL